ncbi:MAG TPA: TatD family hydrolase [bacterium]|nr:TatD family hydrolase [bacterium]
MRTWVDTHLHLDDEAFDPDREAVVARAAAAGVGTMICVGTSIGGSQRAISLADRHPAVWASVGIHPHAADSVDRASVEALAELARHPRVVAVGESGLDYVRERVSRKTQAQAFVAHARLARETGLPLVIHNREASDDVERILQDEEVRTAVMHCFSGTPDLALRWATAGWMISFAGPLTFTKAEALREAARCVPLDRLLVETDAPYLAPAPARGRRCEPAFVVHTARVLAALRNLSEEALASALSENVARVFFQGRARRVAEGGETPRR